MGFMDIVLVLLVIASCARTRALVNYLKSQADAKHKEIAQHSVTVQVD